MFDSLIVPCLFCKEDVIEQTKSGPCDLANYKWDEPNLPTWLMETFNGSEIECYNCGKKFRIVFDFEVVIKDRRLETINNLDYLELKYDEKEKRDGTS